MRLLVITDGENSQIVRDLVGPVSVTYIDTVGHFAHETRFVEGEEKQVGVVVPPDVLQFTGEVNAAYDRLARPDAQQSKPETVALFDGSLRERLFRRVAIRQIVRETGVSEAEAERQLAQTVADSGRPFLDWIQNGGLLELIKAIVEIIKTIGPILAVA